MLDQNLLSTAGLFAKIDSIATPSGKLDSKHNEDVKQLLMAERDRTFRVQQQGQ